MRKLLRMLQKELGNKAIETRAFTIRSEKKDGGNG